jgi:hypothetical protein
MILNKYVNPYEIDSREKLHSRQAPQLRENEEENPTSPISTRDHRSMQIFFAG